MIMIYFIISIIEKQKKKKKKQTHKYMTIKMRGKK